MLLQMPWVTEERGNEAPWLPSTEEGMVASERPPSQRVKAKTHV